VTGTVTRIAPTPSGFLHIGNAVNAVLTAWLARRSNGRLLLRIDDFDAARVREDYLADIFSLLDWLGIHPDSGPSDPRQFHAQWSMARRGAQFRAARDGLLAEHPGVVFVCRCSRRALVAGRCVAACRLAGLTLAPGQAVVRLSVPDGIRVPVGRERREVPAGDHVLWRRDDLPAYHLGSVLVDEELGVTAIVRGADLLDSSALQVHLAGLMHAPAFLAADLRHHALLTAPDGTKLSKSAGAQAHPLDRSEEVRDRILAAARVLGAPIGITEP
jgi:glutamyl-tRNA synthetase